MKSYRISNITKMEAYIAAIRPVAPLTKSEERLRVSERKIIRRSRGQTRRERRNFVGCQIVRQKTI